jgi:hypothetical protein
MGAGDAVDAQLGDEGNPAATACLPQRDAEGIG